MSVSAVSFGAECLAPQAFPDFDIDTYVPLSPNSCQSMFESHGSYSEEEADFLSELLVQQDAVDPVQLLMGDSAESSGMQAAMSDTSTTFANWDTDGVVPITDRATSPVSCLQVPVNPSCLMLQLDYSDVISTWEEMTTDKKHPISQSSSQHITQDQLTSLQPPCMYNPTQPRPAIMDATLNLDLSPASIPSFASIPGLSASSHSVSFPVSHMGCVDTVNGNCMQQHACNPRSAAEKTASLERYREKKATRQCGSGKIRYQIRKTNADNRPRFKGCFVKPSKLAELQLEAALNGDSYLPSSPMISGGSSDSTFA
ncbi:hypothetical protein ABBQ38_007917 [Trebouxia sp. C0009 RCD-2024]